jgi:hypothetical protein
MTELEKLCKRLDIRCLSLEAEPPADGQWPPDARHYVVTLTMPGSRRRLTTSFHQGSGHKAAPTAADVLSCLTLDMSAGEQSFEDFCSDLGYDTDSRKALAIHTTCAALAPRLRAFLGDHFDAVMSAEH